MTARIKHIQRTVAEYYDINPMYITHRTRARQWQQPKYVAMFLARKLTKASYRTLGNYFNRDHSAVRGGVCNIEMRIGNEPNLERDILELTGIITNRKATTEKEILRQKEALAEIINLSEQIMLSLEKIVGLLVCLKTKAPGE